MEELLKQILNKIEIMGTDIKDLKEGQLRIENKIDELEAKNATTHSNIFHKLNSVENDVKFVKDKLNKTEEDVFDIKDHLKIIK